MKTLLLIPTRLELARLPGAPRFDQVLAGRGSWRDHDVALCGFGPIDAAAGAMHALRRFPDVELCLLAGIAGSFDMNAFPVGTVLEGISFRMHGIGAGREPGLLAPEEMQLPAGAAGWAAPTSFALATAAGFGRGLPAVEMLTVCAASIDVAQAKARRTRYPNVAVEEMEGFAVARAASLAGVPFACLRAVSNAAGKREGWSVGTAMTSLAAVLEAY